MVKPPSSKPPHSGKPAGSGKPPSLSPPAGGKGGKAGKGGKGSLHAPLEMKSRTHLDKSHSAHDEKDGAARAKAELARRAKRSAFARWAPVFAMPVVILLMLGGYVFLWFSSASSLKALTAEIFRSEDTHDGWTVRSDDPKVKGFPLSVGVHLTGVEIVAPDRWGGWVWRAEHVVISSDPWGPSQPRFDVVGHSQLRTRGGTLYDLSSEHTRMVLTRQGEGIEGIEALSLTIRNGVAQPVGGAPPLQIASLTIDGKAVPLPLSPPPDSHTETYTASVTLDDAVIPPELAPTIGPVLRHLELNGRLLGPLTPEGQGSLRERLTKWRDDGGVAEIDRFYMDWSPLKLAATGTLALDDRMQPVGALSAQLQGFYETVDALYAGQVMRARDATLARVVVGSMAEPKGGIPTLTTPISLQSGKMILGPVTVMDLPQISWPGPATQRQLPAMRPTYQVDRWGRVIQPE